MNDIEIIMCDLKCEDAPRNTEPRHVFREGIILDQHRYQVVSGRGLHDGG